MVYICVAAITSMPFAFYAVRQLTELYYIRFKYKQYCNLTSCDPMNGHISFKHFKNAI